MLTVYSHQLQAIRATIISTLLDDANLSSMIEYLQELSGGEITNEGGDVYERLLDELKQLRIDGIDSISAYSALSCKYTVLLTVVGLRLFEVILSCYLDLHVLQRVRGKGLKVTKKAMCEILEQSSVEIIGGTLYQDSYEGFISKYNQTLSDTLDYIKSVKWGEDVTDEVDGTDDEEQLYLTYRNLCLVNVSLMLTTFGGGEGPDVSFTGRGGLQQTLIKYLNSLEDMIQFCLSEETTLGVSGYTAEEVPAICIIEEADMLEESVVLLDDKTPIVESFYEDLAEEHADYNLTDNENRIGYLMSKGVPIPRLVKIHMDELTTLYLHELATTDNSK